MNVMTYFKFHSAAIHGPVRGSKARRAANRRLCAGRRRSGSTLVEMLIVLSVASVILGLSVSTIHLLLEAEHEAARSLQFNTSLARLTHAFRGDMHASRHVELPGAEAGNANLLVATSDARQIRYQA